MVLIIIYAILGYWATGHTIYAHSILIGTENSILCKKLVMGFAFGWILIPIAIIKCILFRG